MSTDGTRRPNVILILSDQMQYRRQGRLDPESSTPHLDGLAEAGVDFSHCFVSNPQCTPSRTSLLTGLHPHEAGVMTNYGFFDHAGHVDDTHDTVGQAFARAGYRTAYFGKSHLGFPLQRLGYDVVEDHGEVVGGLAEVDRSIAADACDFIRSAPPDRPFFLTVSFHEPHPPFELVPGFEPAQESFARPASMRDLLDGRPEFQLRRQRSDEGAMTEGRYDDEVRRYLSMIAHLDSLVGDIVAGLREAGAWDDTVVAFTSDHGDLMGAHGMRLKGTLPYDELFRVPLIVKGVDSPDLGVVDDLVSNVAIPATLLDLAGVARTGAWHARSRLPMPSLVAGSGEAAPEMGLRPALRRLLGRAPLPPGPDPRVEAGAVLRARPRARALRPAVGPVRAAERRRRARPRGRRRVARRRTRLLVGRDGRPGLRLLRVRGLPERGRERPPRRQREVGDDLTASARRTRRRSR